MTQLTDKMERLREDYTHHICRFNDAPQTCDCYIKAIDACIALVDADPKHTKPEVSNPSPKEANYLSE